MWMSTSWTLRWLSRKPSFRSAHLKHTIHASNVLCSKLAKEPRGGTFLSHWKFTSELCWTSHYLATRNTDMNDGSECKSNSILPKLCSQETAKHLCTFGGYFQRLTFSRVPDPPSWKVTPSFSEEIAGLQITGARLLHPVQFLTKLLCSHSTLESNWTRLLKKARKYGSVQGNYRVD